MSSLFSPKVSTPAPMTPPPSIDTPGVQAAADAERRRQRTASGRASTMLTGGTAKTGSDMIGTSTLLGG